jgi:hypothetical protein
MRRFAIAMAATVGLVLGASQYAGAAAAGGLAIKAPAETLQPFEAAAETLKPVYRYRRGRYDGCSWGYWGMHRPDWLWWENRRCGWGYIPRSSPFWP